jgi:hypothetical protein
LKNEDTAIEIDLSNNRLEVSKELVGQIMRHLNPQSVLNLEYNSRDTDEVLADELNERLMAEERSQQQRVRLKTAEKEIACCKFAYKSGKKSSAVANRENIEHWKSPDWEYETATNLFGGHECALHRTSDKFVVTAEGFDEEVFIKELAHVVSCEEGGKKRVGFAGAARVA